MSFRIETEARGTFTVFVLSGRIETSAIAELRRLFELQTACHHIVLDLKDVSTVDREVMHFFARFEADGVKLRTALHIFANGWKEKRIED